LLRVLLSLPAEESNAALKLVADAETGLVRRFLGHVQVAFIRWGSGHLRQGGEGDEEAAVLIADARAGE